MGLTLLSLPAAMVFYMRAVGLSARVYLPIFLVSLVLSTDWFFLMGFLAFRLALALAISSAALAEGLRTRWSAARYLGYLAVVVVGYLMHLTAPVFPLCGSCRIGGGSSHPAKLDARPRGASGASGRRTHPLARRVSSRGARCRRSTLNICMSRVD